MNFTDAMIALDLGYALKRPEWNAAIVEGYVGFNFVDAKTGQDIEQEYNFEREDYEATDWEIVTL